jgi:preprotein translocase subunit YajC
MQRQKKKTQAMLSSLQNGNTVLTSGGIVGTIISIGDDDTLVLRVKPDNVKLQVARSAVSNLVTGEVKK